MTKRFLLVLACLLWPLSLHAQTYTISPSPNLLVLDANANPVNASCVWTYVAGTSTPATTYSDVSGTPNSNPIIVPSTGRVTIFLVPGNSYKYIYESPPCNSGLHGAVILTAPNVVATPASSANLDLIGTAGEALSLGNCVYLSDGSGSKTVGSWYKCDPANPYSSTTPIVGMAPAAIAALGMGTIRLGGQAPVSVSLTPGSTYYATTAGALTLTAPANNQRALGVADSTSTLVLSGNPAAPLPDLACNGRLTLTTALPVTTADVTAATTLFWTPTRGNRCALYDGSRWTVRSFAELSIAVPATTSQMYDVWLYDNAGTLALELLAWTNDTTRATALVAQDGVWVKTGVTTRRYLGSFRTTGVSGQTEDSFTKRFVWNYYNRARRPVRVTEATNSWNYSTHTWRQANGAAGNQIAVVVGVAESPIDLGVLSVASHSTAGHYGAVGIGEDSTSAIAAGSLTGQVNAPVATYQFLLRATLTTVPAIGYHFYAWLEIGNGTVTLTFYGDGNTPTELQSGLGGVWES